MSAGTLGLGLWLARLKERTTGKRGFTAEEYGRWVETMQDIEQREMGFLSEFCFTAELAGGTP